MDICNGLKPEIKCEISRSFKEIMEKYVMMMTMMKKFEAEESNKNFIQYDPSEMHPEAIYTSRHISKLTIPEYNTFSKFKADRIVEDEENEAQEMEFTGN
ncbi:hypothetical protein Glove_395g30 [Diversispora epigaea]|uniref:Uncharacterized protein n=1 Tax=Diversispora epigaea TaxID=1348612 RepID=A0A397H213_9GLOM|nr:hypothetical protein Glove_395g30 [Diversispora epigaea]